MHTDRPLLLIVLDGWGYRESISNNAILQAKIPIWDHLWASCPHTLLSASGLDVGLPVGQMGNSEVGHMTMGAGRVIFQDLTRINLAIENGEFYKNKVLLDAFARAKQKNSAIHILGLLSPGGIHSHEDHIAALIKMAEQHSVGQSNSEPIYLHAFLDGRDTPPQSAIASVTKFQPYIASIMGRFYAMDRDQRAERTQAAIDLLINNKPAFTAADAISALNAAYARGETDEFVQPTQIKPVNIKTDDIVICMNFRTDRMRQICYALLQAEPQLKGSILTLTEYDRELPSQVIFAPQSTTETFADVISAHHLKQLHVAETEKYAHVTFFFNAGRETAVAGEERVMISSPKVKTYDLQPQMGAKEITAVLLNAIKNKAFDVIICNFANADMVGHTGNLAATIIAIETIDHCLGQISQAIREFGGAILITADHGNAETMWDESSKQPHTAHTTNLVPLIYVGPKPIKFKTDKTYGLQDIAPTMLELLGLDKPNVMTGTTLIEPVDVSTIPVINLNRP